MYKGFLISTAIYLQPSNTNIYSGNLKNVTLYLDAPLVLRILGLCSEAENRKAKQFYDLLKGKVTFKMFQHSFKELCTIIKAYEKSRITHERGKRTLKFFDINRYSITDVKRYYSQIPQKLKFLDIVVESVDSVIDRTSNEYITLRKNIKDKISSYQDNDVALQVDTDSLFLMKQLRGEKIVTAIILIVFLYSFCHFINLLLL